MTVYVDRLFKRSPKSLQARKYGNFWCHLLSDSIEELHDFARELGLKRGYYQHRPIPHYDLTRNKRQQAIKLGAAKISTKEYLLRLRRSQKARKEELERIFEICKLGPEPEPERPMTKLHKRGQGGAVILD